MIEREEYKILKSYIKYDDLDTLLNRESKIIETTENAIIRENRYSNDFILSLIDTQTTINDDGTYTLIILIKKETI